MQKAIKVFVKIILYVYSRITLTKMRPEEIKIEVYDKREKSTTTLHVEKISAKVFRMTENDIFNCSLTLGTEFETRINEEGKHEIVRILKESGFNTRRFLLSPQLKTSYYELLGEEIIKQGGFWQVDFGGIATINLPKDSLWNIDDIFKEFGFYLSEID